MTLPEAEAALEAADADGKITTDPSNVPSTDSTRPFSMWRTGLLAGVSLAATLAWIAAGAFRVAATAGLPEDTWTTAAALPFLNAVPWIYAVVRVIVSPKPTPHYDLFVLFAIQLAGAVLVTGGIAYDRYLGAAWPSGPTISAHALNLGAILSVLLIILATPLNVPSANVRKDDVGRSISPDEYTTLWGWITFGWISPLVLRGKHARLEEADVWELSPTMQSRALFARFTAAKRASLVRWVFATNSLDLILDFVLTIISAALNYARPFFLNRILASLSSGSSPESRANALIYTFLMFGVSLLRSEIDLQHLWIGRRGATRVRSELMAIIYAKALVRKDFSGLVSSEGAGGADSSKAGAADIGKIVNVMAVDANMISTLIFCLHLVYSAPVEVVVAIVFLYRLLGVSALVGIASLVISWPINRMLMNKTLSIQRDLAAARDKRTSIVNEVITAVKFIKFFAWEDHWIERALAARRAEMHLIARGMANSVVTKLLYALSPLFISAGSFFTYTILLGHTLDVATAFTALALFGMLREPLNMLPEYVIMTLQCAVSFNRVAAFLDEDEVDARVSVLKRGGGGFASRDAEEGLGFEAASFVWNELQGDDKGKKPVADDVDPAVQQAQRFELKDLTVKFPESAITVVTGPTASGKTALLMALLGEMTQTAGRLILSKDTTRVDAHGLTHSISYAAQTPWLQHQTIKENILFGHPYDAERYRQVIDGCALTTDLNILEDGDQTEIGARGVSLSGGQKARVALARAVYARTKFVLLDDPLSAVDSHTARFLFDRLLRGPLLANRTVILVTHHVDLVLPATGYLVRMLDGRIEAHGSPSELRVTSTLRKIIAAESEQVADNNAQVADEKDAAGDLVTDVAKKSEATTKQPRKLVSEEHRETGAVKWGIYHTYLQASSYWTWVLLISLIVIVEVIGVGEKFWIRIWGEAYDRPESSVYASFASSTTTASGQTTLQDFGLGATTALTASYPGFSGSSSPSTSLPNANAHPLFYVGVYAAIEGAYALIKVLMEVVQYVGAYRASQALFKRLLSSVMRATMRWHDTTPSGRMLNRFTKDIETIDSELVESLERVNTSLAMFFVSVITVAVIFPWFLVPAAFIGFVYFDIARGYLSTGRDLRRMEANTRSPIFSSFSELLEGIVTVRAFSVERRFLNEQHKRVDLTTQMWYTFWMTSRWLLFRYDALGALAVLITALFSITRAVDAGLAGVCITSAMALTTGAYWTCRFWTELELNLNSVERVVEYLNLPQEPPAVINDSRPPAYWPSSSKKEPLLKVEDLAVKYAPDLPNVLHGISFELAAGERVGLLGRTGSGKSTLAMSLLRFVDPTSGRIVIDGIDITKIGIQDLRSRLTFVPQDATLFSGTVRENLDPLNEHSDSECVDVLRRVHLIKDGNASTSYTASRDSLTTQQSAAGLTMINEDPISLSTQVSAGGANFSHGQRQLFALSRALLRRSKIVILDEATSALDFESDAAVQDVIRTQFGDALLLTVAHRLKTIVDYDRLIMLDEGRIVEFDTPHCLMRKQEGVFRSMCEKSGMFEELQVALGV